MFVVGFVGAPDRPEITVICMTQHPETLMNENIVHKEIGESIERNSQPCPKQEAISLQHPEK
jgi:hypothetical protein